MKIKSIRKVKDLGGKTIFLRSDFNVPLKSGKILDDYKIVAALPTIRFLSRHKCRIVIATHLGRPNGRKNKEFSVKPIVKKLSALLGKKVVFIDSIGKNTKAEVSKLKEDEIILLENLRFYKEEKENNNAFAKNLADLADFYVNNAFAVSHRDHASLSAIKKYLPSYAGLLLEKEVKSLGAILKPKKPLVAVMGGAKIDTKISLLKEMKKLANSILIGGALANNFLKGLKHEVGKSLVSEDNIKLAKKIYSKKIILPVDAIVTDKFNGSGKVAVKKIDKINKSDIILDIGPETIRLYSKIIKNAKTIVWNGPMGKFEINHFQHGTLSIARVIASCSTGKAFGVAGGGETIKALKTTKMLDYVDWTSTGGGAMLSFLSKKKMPGLKGIVS